MIFKKKTRKQTKIKTNAALILEKKNQLDQIL